MSKPVSLGLGSPALIREMAALHGSVVYCHMNKPLWSAKVAVVVMELVLQQ